MDRRHHTPTGAEADPEPFASWYRNRWHRTRRLAGHLLDDWAEAEDLASDVLLRVWSHWQDAGPPEHPEAYLRRAVLNEVATRLRRRAAERAAVARAAAVDHHDGPEPLILDRVEASRLLAGLPAPVRDVMVWHYLDDQPCAAIATRTGLAPASVRSRLHRGRARLAQAAAA